ncbi:unnamed protein product, partial [Prunus brigantina]
KRKRKSSSWFFSAEPGGLAVKVADGGIYVNIIFLLNCETHKAQVHRRPPDAILTAKPLGSAEKTQEEVFLFRFL